MVSFPRQAYISFLCAALFYLYQFILRVSPSVMVSDMMTAFHIDAVGVSLLSSIPLYAYSLMQIPAGIFADTFGVRRCLLMSIFLCMSGAFLFGIAEHFWVAICARLLVGIGSASAFLSVAKVALEGFGAKNQSLFFGFAMVAGTIGALNGGNAIALFLEYLTWREVILILGAFGSLVWILNFYGLKKKKKISSLEVLEKKLEGETLKASSSLMAIIKTPQCWISGIVALGMYSCLSVLADLWGISFCMQAYAITRMEAAQLTSLIYVGLCLGSLVIPFLSDRVFSKKSLIIVGALGILLSLILIGVLTNPSLLVVGSLFFSIGFFIGAELLCFTLACEAGPKGSEGTITGFINGIIMMGGALLQYFFGLILEHNWQGQVSALGTPLYSKEAYYQALLLLVVVLVLSIIGALFISKNPIRPRQ
ncbi:MAG: MFS transporter [Proteobacteria bacterium]|nr:MFS transporter [Pseudomonadota bacterium]